MELSQIIFDLENQVRSNLILIGKLIAYRLIKLTFYLKSIEHVKQCYYNLDYVVMNLT